MQTEGIQRITLGSRLVRMARGETVFHNGDISDGFYIVVHGQIKLAFTSHQGMEKVVQLFEPGSSFGEATMFLEKPYLLSSQALVDSVLLHVGKAAVFNEIERNPEFARRMLAGLSMRLHTLVRDVEAYSLHSCTQRVIGYLLRKEQEHCLEKNSLHFQFPANKMTIASLLNISPETFSRILHDLSVDGLIRMEGKCVTILDIERLRAY